jgi:hypothetical protein
VKTYNGRICYVEPGKSRGRGRGNAWVGIWVDLNGRIITIYRRKGDLDFHAYDGMSVYIDAVEVNGRPNRIEIRKPERVKVTPELLAQIDRIFSNE